MISERQILIDAFESMKGGVLFMLIGSLIITVGGIGVYGGLLAALFAGGSGAGRGEVFAIAGIASIVALLIVFIGIIVWIWGFFFKFLGGASAASKIRPSLSLPTTLMRIGYLGGYGIMIVALILLLVSIVAAPLGIIGGLLLLISFLLLLIGFVGLIIFSFYLYNEEKDTLYLIAAIMIVLSIVFGITMFIGMILLYIAFGNSANRLRAQAVAQPPAMA